MIDVRDMPGSEPAAALEGRLYRPLGAGHWTVDMDMDTGQACTTRLSTTVLHSISSYFAVFALPMYYMYLQHYYPTTLCICYPMLPYVFVFATLCICSINLNIILFLTFICIPIQFKHHECYLIP